MNSGGKLHGSELVSDECKYSCQHLLISCEELCMIYTAAVGIETIGTFPRHTLSECLR